LIEISVQIIAKSNAKMTQPRRVRIITPLGKDAVVLVDSNGKALKHAGKGFTNHFKNVVIEGHEQDHGAGGGLLIDDVSSQSSASITNVNDLGDLNVDGEDRSDPASVRQAVWALVFPPISTTTITGPALEQVQVLAANRDLRPELPVEGDGMGPEVGQVDLPARVKVAIWTRMITTCRRNWWSPGRQSSSAVIRSSCLCRSTARICTRWS
jgi:hypothetical protein